MIKYRYLDMRKYILLISLFFSLNLFSQNVSIKGTVKSADNKQLSGALIRLLTYNDMLTYEQSTIYETHSDEKGRFTIEAEIDDVVLAQIAVDLERVDMLLKPNSSYEIEITIPKQEESVSYFERQNPNIKIINSDDDNLYYQYYMSDLIIDDFILNNFNKIYRSRQISILDSLDSQIEKELGKIDSDFIKDNIRYRKAALQMVINNDNAKKVINQHFNKQKILHSHPAYMNLFQEIFSNYLSSKQFHPSDINNLLYDNYDSFLKYINEKDVFLADNKDLAEIIMAWNFKRMYYEMPNERKHILAYIKSITQNTKNQKNKEIINDILKQINRLSFNSDAPAFALKDENNNIIKSSDYEDDIVLLQFVNKVSDMTEHQFKILKDLSEQWNDSVKIITIATNDSFNDFRQLFDNKGYKWKLLNLGDNIVFLDEYQIRTFPDYIILGKDNKIGMAPAPAPDQNIDFHIRRIYNYYHKK